jgi:hypothetical protein
MGNEEDDEARRDRHEGGCDEPASDIADQVGLPTR